MSDDSWSADFEKARGILKARFPDLCCLRCGKDKFLMRLWSDESLSPGLSAPQDNNVLELICDNCGYLEKHVVPILNKTEAA